MPPPSPWWAPHVHADRRPLLAMRARILAHLRVDFLAQDFIEVETAILQVSPGNETHLHAFATDIVSPGGDASRLYLHTSPEFACKKLLAAGEQKIFQFARVFRNRERSDLHHPEFTMLEWYRVGDPYEALMTDCVGMMRAAAETAGTRQFVFRGITCDPFAEPERLTVADAFMRHAGIDLSATLSAGATDRDALVAAATAAGIRTADDDNWSDVFSRVLVERIEPHLGVGRPTLLTEYPAPEAALARPTPHNPRYAERFELFACRVELANGFEELTDTVEQRRRFGDAMAAKRRLYGESYPIDEDFLNALAVMPPACGCALGFDRLIMLATGAPRIDQVIWTPVAEAGQ